MFLPLLGIFLGSLMPLQASAVPPSSLSLSFGNASLRQGGSSYGTISIDSLEGIKTLVVSAYFDTNVFNVDSYDNLTTTVFVDGYAGDGYVRFSYIFNEEPSAGSDLFRYFFTVAEDAPVGDYHVDILVEEAYDINLESVQVNATSGTIHVDEAPLNKTASIVSNGPTQVSFGDEADISYSFSTHQIASGSLEWTYDDDALEFLGFTADDFLEGKIYDLAASAGLVRLSFICNEYGSGLNIGTLAFAPKKNEEQDTSVSLFARELFDLELDPVNASNVEKPLHIAHNSAIVPYNADISLSTQRLPSYAKQIDIKVHLGANSHLGAGDFILTYDPEQLHYLSGTKRIATDFLNINDKKTNEGILKFSLISTTGIVQESDILSLSFDVLSMPESYHMDLGFSGSGLSDSLTEPIALRFLSPGIDFEAYEATDYAEEFLSLTGPICTSAGDKETQLSGVWGQLKDHYQSLLSSEQAIFSNVVPDYVGDSDNVLERALGRYHYIVTKYGFENYMNAVINYSSTTTISTSSVPSSAWLLTAICTTTALGAILLLKKKRP